MTPKRPSGSPQKTVNFNVASNETKHLRNSLESLSKLYAEQQSKFAQEKKQLQQKLLSTSR